MIVIEVTGQEWQKLLAEGDDDHNGRKVGMSECELDEESLCRNDGMAGVTEDCCIGQGRIRLIAGSE